MIDLSYRVRDFILFSRDIYAEILTDYNLALWPWQIVIFVIAVMLMPLSHRFPRIAAAVLAGFWVMIGLLFHAKYFLEINWAAKYFSWLFFLEAVLIFAVGILHSDFHFFGAEGVPKWVGRCFYIAAVILPFNLLVTPQIQTVTLFGWGAEATALGTWGLALASKGQTPRWILTIIPILWLFVAGLISYGLK